MTARQSPNEAQPVVQRVRFRYSKTGRMRFASHRDFARALERAVRRGGVPVAMSGGFTPHPRISYANAAPTGVASAAEYVEIGLAEQRPVAEVATAVSAGLPAGFAIEDAVEVSGGSVSDGLVASRWRIDVPGVSAAELSAAVEGLLARAPVTIMRVTKSGRREVDVTGNWIRSEITDGRLEVVVRHGTPAVRPEDMVAVLELSAVSSATVQPVCTRVAQGPLTGEPPDIADPLRA